MARLEYISFVPHRCNIVDGDVQWTPVNGGRVIDGIPQIIFSDLSPWREANLWACQRACSRDVILKTVQTDITALLSYARWLEKEKVSWWDFPAKKAERCLVRYRGALIDERDEGKLAPSTASQRMAAVIRFYRWLHASQLLSSVWPIWNERIIGVHLIDAHGFERTVHVTSTDLAIKNRRLSGDTLEDGLLPVSAYDRDAILTFAKEYASIELFLMLTIGFFTGMRLGTLADLRIQTLEQAIPDPATPELFRLSLGPGASPPVHTKYGVTGQCLITRTHLDALKSYVYSVRRLKRQAKASAENSDRVFLTRFGQSYAQRSSDKSPALNVEMHALRKNGIVRGLAVLRNFHFHQSRCTFATELVGLLIPKAGAINALAIVKDALLHKNEAATLRYIKFVEKTPAKVDAANAFTRSFLGVINRFGATDDE